MIPGEVEILPSLSDGILMLGDRDSNPDKQIQSLLS